jgi:hypothetical protein
MSAITGLTSSAAIKAQMLVQMQQQLTIFRSSFRPARRRSPMAASASIVGSTSMFAAASRGFLPMRT